MRHAEKHVLAVAVLEAEKLLADALETAAFHPELRRKDDRHLDFLAVDSVHLVADNRLDFGDDALAERKYREQTGGDLTAVAAAYEKNVADGLGVPGSLFQTLSDKA